MPITPPTDAELATLVRTQLRQYGIDTSVLPAAADPTTGLPTEASLVNGVVSLIKTSVSFIAAYDVDANYKQKVQETPPVEYPGPFAAWTDQV